MQRIIANHDLFRSDPTLSHSWPANLLFSAAANLALAQTSSCGLVSESTFLNRFRWLWGEGRTVSNFLEGYEGGGSAAPVSVATFLLLSQMPSKFAGVLLHQTQLLAPSNGFDL